MTLQDVTGQESGIIIFGDRELLICNWSSFEGIPRVLMGALISLDDSIPEVLMQEEWSEAEIINYLTGKNLIYSDLKEELTIEKPAKIYHLNGAVTIIAPANWG